MSGIEDQKVVSVPNFGTEEKQNMKKPFLFLCFMR